MQNFIQFLLRNGTLWSFLLLEFICLYFVVNYNQKQQQIFATTNSRVVGGIYERVDGIRDFFSVRNDNKRLNAEIARLQTIITGYNTLFSQDERFSDTSFVEGNWRYYPARIISKTTIGANNTYTIDIGLEDGIKEHLGVVTLDGVVGVVRQVTDNYAVVMSSLHRKSAVSAAIRNRGVHGSLVWNKMDTRKMQLDFVPHYFPIEKGDTVETSGYSFLFPEKIPIGIIADPPTKAGDYYQIDVQLNNNIKDLEYVYVVENIDREELEKLEHNLEDE